MKVLNLFTGNAKQIAIFIDSISIDKENLRISPSIVSFFNKQKCAHSITKANLYERTPV